jgi:aminopeptidase YwaD
MKSPRHLAALAATLFLSLAFLFAQEREDRTLLSWTQMRAIINEASGERALQATIEMAPYPRVRPRSEYEARFRESEVVERLAKEYGFRDVAIESYPSPMNSWIPVQGELWLVEPEARRLYDIHEVVISLCSGSESGDVTAELMDVGVGGRPEDYQGKDVGGKIVLGAAGANTLQRLAVFERGAVGVLSYNSMRPDDYPDQILSQSIGAAGPEGKKPGFGWSIAPRTGRQLAARLAQGEKIRLRSKVTADSIAGEMELVHAVIPGDGSSDQEAMISAHLFEGYIKQGANDDNSGCALTLEMGRTLNRLVSQGDLPKPRRNIHFLWVPEIMGTMAWLQKHPDTKAKLIADLNFDMEGLGLRLGLSAWTINRTPDTLPSYLNDLCANILEFVANLNRERLRYRHHGYGFTLPVVAPTGSRDPFYYQIEKHYGASDHAVYINQGIPAVIFSTWPDMFYHSSQDTPEILDATQFKRAAVVSTAAMTVLAAAEDATAAKVTAEALARGTGRMGQAQSKALGYLADATDAASLMDGYKEARNAVLHQGAVEKAVVQSSAVLYTSPAEAGKKLAVLDGLIEQRSAALLKEIRAFYEIAAQRLKTAAVEPTLSDAEAKAARIMVERPAGEQGGMMGFGGPRGGATDRLPPGERAAVEAAMAKVPQHMTGELNALIGQKKSVLEIRNFLSGEFEPLPLADLMEYLSAQEKLGRVKTAAR